MSAEQLLPAPRSQLHWAACRRIAVALLPVLLIAASIIPGSGDFLQPTTVLGQVMAGLAVTGGPLLIYMERRHDLKQRLVSHGRRIAFIETGITIVVDIAIVICGAMLLVAVFAFLYLV